MIKSYFEDENQDVHSHFYGKSITIKKYRLGEKSIMFSEIDPEFLILFGILIALVVTFVATSYRHVHKTGFKHKFIHLADGGLKMEFYKFGGGGLQTTRTKRFYNQYRVGMTITHENKQYKISKLNEADDTSLLVALILPDMKIIAYLEEVTE